MATASTATTRPLSPWTGPGPRRVRVHTTDLLENPGLLWDYHLLAVPGGLQLG